MPERFESRPEIKKIHEGVFLYKNFISEEEASKFNEDLSSFKPEEWFKHENIVPGDISGEYWDGKLSLDIVDHLLHSKFINYFAPEFWILSYGNFLKLDTGESSLPEHSLAQNMEYYKEIIPYKLALYVSDFGGGEIVFPNLDFEYKPETGDLLIFKASLEHEHYTKEVTSGTRYVYIDYLVKNPRYFMP